MILKFLFWLVIVTFGLTLLLIAPVPALLAFVVVWIVHVTLIEKRKKGLRHNYR